MASHLTLVSDETPRRNLVRLLVHISKKFRDREYVAIRIAVKDKHRQWRLFSGGAEPESGACECCPFADECVR